MFSLHLNLHSYSIEASWYLNINSLHFRTRNNYMFCVFVKRGEKKASVPAVAHTLSHSDKHRVLRQGPTKFNLETFSSTLHILGF